MIERYIEITCDVCGEIEWSPSNVLLVEFRREFIPTWKRKGALDMCPTCVHAGHDWDKATLHTSQSANSDNERTDPP